MDERAYRTPLQPAEPAALVAQAGRLAGLREETLAWGAAWLVAANVVYAACQWVTVVALAKLGSPTAHGVFGLATLIAVVAFGGTLAAGVWALAAAWTGLLFAVDLRAARAFEPLLAWPHAANLARLAGQGASLGAVNGLLATTQSLPRYVLQLSHGAAAVGYFTALSSIVPALAQVASAAGHAAAPRLGWAASGDGRRYRALAGRLLAGGVLAGAGVVAAVTIAGRPFLRLAYAEQYVDYHTTFVLVALAAGFWIIDALAFFPLVAAQRLGLKLKIHCIGLVATGLAAVLLVPTFGIDGAAPALVAGCGTAALLSTGALVRWKGAP